MRRAYGKCTEDMRRIDGRHTHGLQTFCRTMEAGGREMRKEERNYEVKINGIPQLKDVPKDLLDLLCVALLDSILSDKEDEATCMENTEVPEQSEF